MVGTVSGFDVVGFSAEERALGIGVDAVALLSKQAERLSVPTT